MAIVEVAAYRVVCDSCEETLAFNEDEQQAIDDARMDGMITLRGKHYCSALCIEAANRKEHPDATS